MNLFENREGSFHYEVRARCDIEDAVRLLSDFSRYDRLHPLIVRVRPIPAAAGALRSYAVTDALTWGPFRFATRYRADLVRVTADVVESVAHQWPRTTLRNQTRLTAEPGGVTHVETDIVLSTPRPLFGYAFRQARTAHTMLADRIRSVLERTGSA